MHPDRSLPYSLTVQWESPANSDKFDLDHYTIQALSSVVDKRYELNVTGSKLEYPFGLIMNTSILQHELSNLSVSAVSRCSQKGVEACRNANANAIQPEVYNTGKSAPRLLLNTQFIAKHRAIIIARRCPQQ